MRRLHGCRHPDAIGREVTTTLLLRSGPGLFSGNKPGGFIISRMIDYLQRLDGSSSHPSSMKRTPWPSFAVISLAGCCCISSSLVAL